MINKKFWENKKVFITGHTGFKGAWLSIWLNLLGAKVFGYSLNPPTDPSLFELANIGSFVETTIGDIRDLDNLTKTLKRVKPDIVFHMAAQSLVKESYKNPVDTYSINVMGTVNLFESLRQIDTVKVILNVTTDKCYENKEWQWGYREIDILGGRDPYSNSKACSELITSAYKNSFFNPLDYDKHGVAIATSRAGNVIGAGDWAKDRLIPDCIRAISKNKKIIIRNPNAIRPWQHVLEPLNGYILLAERLYQHGVEFGEAWNFGPEESQHKPVQWVVEKVLDLWGDRSLLAIDQNFHQYEANLLKLDCSKAKSRLGWEPRWDLNLALDKTVSLYKDLLNNESVLERCEMQIKEYERM